MKNSWLSGVRKIKVPVLVGLLGLMVSPALSAESYVENFEQGPGGWIGWVRNQNGAARLELLDGAVVSRSPWWLDYNHAPPGGGYLHLLFVLHTSRGPVRRPYEDFDTPNQFILGGFSRNFTNAKVSARLRGEINLRGATCALLVQSKVRDKFVNYVLQGQTFHVSPQWEWHSVTLTVDPRQWTALGTRSDRTDWYGESGIEDVLKDLNGNIIFVLFPLNVKPEGKISGDPHRLKAGEDYPVRKDLLPSGYVMMDEVRIDFAADKR